MTPTAAVDDGEDSEDDSEKTSSTLSKCPSYVAGRVVCGRLHEGRRRRVTPAARHAGCTAAPPAGVLCN